MGIILEYGPKDYIRCKKCGARVLRTVWTMKGICIKCQAKQDAEEIFDENYKRKHKSSSRPQLLETLRDCTMGSRVNSNVFK